MKTCVRYPHWGGFHFSWKNKAVAYSEIIWVNINNKKGNITYYCSKLFFFKESKQAWNNLKFKEAQTNSQCNTPSCFCWDKFPLAICWHLKFLVLTHDKEMNQQIYKLFSFKHKFYKLFFLSFYISILKVLESLILLSNNLTWGEGKDIQNPDKFYPTRCF